MPQLAAINTENGLVAGLASLAATTNGIAENRRRDAQLEIQRDAQRRQQEEHVLRTARYEAETAAVAAKQEREALQQESVRAAIGQSIQGLRAEAQRQLSPGEKMQKQIDHRLSRVKATTQRFLEAGDQRGAQAYVAQARQGLQRFVVSRGFQQELEMVGSAVSDGLLPPELGQQLAGAIQEEMAGGGKPGKASARIDAIRKAAAVASVREQSWTEADQRIAGIISTTRDPELKKRLQLEATLSQSPSMRSKSDPDSTLAKLERMALGEDPSKRAANPPNAAGGVMGVGPGGAPSMAELEEFTRTPEYQAYLKRQKAERSARGGVGVSPKQEDTHANDFVRLPPKARAQAVSALRELVNTPGGIEDIQGLLDQFNLDPSTLPPDLIRELLGSDSLETIFEVGP